MFKLQANFRASLKYKKNQTKIKFLNKYGPTERNHLNSNSLQDLEKLA